MAAWISRFSPSLTHVRSGDGSMDPPALARYVSLSLSLLLVLSHGRALGEEGGGNRVDGRSDLW
jgi:hypothetical protein